LGGFGPIPASCPAADIRLDHDGALGHFGGAFLAPNRRIRDSGEWIGVMSDVDYRGDPPEAGAVARRNGTEVARISVLGIPVACIDTAGLVAEIDRFLDNRVPGDGGRFVCFRDVHGIVLAQNDPAILKAHHDAFLVVADGALVYSR
jgi:hypothetical protein